MKKVLKIIAAVIFGFFGLLYIYAQFGNDETHGQEQQSAATETAQPSQASNNEPPLELTSEEVLVAYKANEIAANKKFKGHKLLVSGKIDSINADIADKAAIVFKTKDQYDFMKPIASLADSEQDKAAQLSKGQNIKVLCTDVTEMAGTPMLNGCVLQQS